MRIFIIFFILLSFHASLYASVTRLPDSVVWGIYCGECVGNCSTMRKIDSSSLNIDKSNKFFNSKPSNYLFKGTNEPKSEYEKYKWILEEPVPTIIDKKFEIFGQPDAYDQCGYYISYSVDGCLYRVLIDPDKVPKEMEVTIEKLFKKITITT